MWKQTPPDWLKKPFTAKPCHAKVKKKKRYKAFKTSFFFPFYFFFFLFKVTLNIKHRKKSISYLNI